jgi:hypothetical protein
MSSKTGWHSNAPVKRYGFSIGRNLVDSRLYPVLVLAIAAAAVFLLQPISMWSLLVVGPLIAMSIYNLIRPISSTWYVELGADELTIYFVGATCIRYQQLDSAERLVPRGFFRAFAAAMTLLDHLFGGTLPSSLDTRVRLKFKGWVWCTLFPPLRIPRREWPLPMEYPEEFVSDVSSRIAFISQQSP